MWNARQLLPVHHQLSRAAALLMAISSTSSAENLASISLGNLDCLEDPSVQHASGAYNHRGYTSNGSPFFQAGENFAERYHYYLYYDSDCNGDGAVPGGWFIANERPNETASTALLGAAGKCNDGGGGVKIRHKPQNNDDTLAGTVPLPGKFTLWEVWCNNVWEEDDPIEVGRYPATSLECTGDDAALCGGGGGCGLWGCTCDGAGVPAQWWAYGGFPCTTTTATTTTTTSTTITTTTATGTTTTFTTVTTITTTTATTTTTASTTTATTTTSVTTATATTDSKSTAITTTTTAITIITTTATTSDTTAAPAAADTSTAAATDTATSATVVGTNDGAQPSAASTTNAAVSTAATAVATGVSTVAATTATDAGKATASPMAAATTVTTTTTTGHQGPKDREFPDNDDVSGGGGGRDGIGSADTTGSNAGSDPDALEGPEQKKKSTVGVIVGLCVLLLVGVGLVLVALQWKKTHQHQAMVLGQAQGGGVPGPKEGAKRGPSTYAVVQNAAFQLNGNGAINPRFSAESAASVAASASSAAPTPRIHGSGSGGGSGGGADYAAHRKLPAVYLTNEIGSLGSNASNGGGAAFTGGGDGMENINSLPEYAMPGEFDPGAGPNPVQLTPNVLYQSADEKEGQPKQPQQQLSGQDADYAVPNSLYTGTMPGKCLSAGTELTNEYAEATELYAGGGNLGADDGTRANVLYEGGAGASGTELTSEYAEATELYAGSGDLGPGDRTSDAASPNGNFTAGSVGSAGNVSYLEPSTMQPGLYDDGVVPGFSFKGSTGSASEGRNRNRAPTYAEPFDDIYSGSVGNAAAAAAASAAAAKAGGGSVNRSAVQLIPNVMYQSADGNGNGTDVTDGTRNNALYEPSSLMTEPATYAEVDEVEGFRGRGNSFC